MIGCRPTLAFSRAAGLGREHVQHMVAHEIAAISLDAKRRRLERDVGPVLGFCPIVPEEHGCSGKAS